jgi:hypothetical protein
MGIPLEAVLVQIENELKKLKIEGNQAKQKERASAIKVLCELILQDENERFEHSERQVLNNLIGTKPLEKKKKEEEDANGDSIFDF